MPEDKTILALTPAERRVVGRLAAQVQQVVREHNEEMSELVGLFCAKRGYEPDGFALQPHKGKLVLVREDERSEPEAEKEVETPAEKEE